MPEFSDLSFQDSLGALPLPNPPRLQEGIALIIIARLSHMLAAVQLDDNRCFETNEVTDKAANLALSPELEPVQLTPTQMPPQAVLGFGSVFAEMAGVIVHARRTSTLRGVTMA
jgi:hypothetical protein